MFLSKLFFDHHDTRQDHNEEPNVAKMTHSVHGIKQLASSKLCAGHVAARRVVVLAAATVRWRFSHGAVDAISRSNCCSLLEVDAAKPVSQWREAIAVATVAYSCFFLFWKELYTHSQW